MDDWLDFKATKEGYCSLVSEEGVPLLIHAKDVKVQIRRGAKVHRFPVKEIEEASDLE